MNEKRLQGSVMSYICTFVEYICEKIFRRCIYTYGLVLKVWYEYLNEMPLRPSAPLFSFFFKKKEKKAEIGKTVEVI